MVRDVHIIYKATKNVEAFNQLYFYTFKVELIGCIDLRREENFDLVCKCVCELLSAADLVKV